MEGDVKKYTNANGNDSDTNKNINKNTNKNTIKDNNINNKHIK